MGRKVNGCDYLLGRVTMLEGATAYVQTAGEVVYFPSKWLHDMWLILIYGCAMNDSIFCYIIYSYESALEPWSVGIGG